VLYLLGFSVERMNVYIIVVGFQRCQPRQCAGCRHLCAGAGQVSIVTPDFPSLDHSSEREAIDRNDAAHFAFIDYLSAPA